MNSDIMNWLRTSVFGLILLGTIGSLLAIALLKLLKLIFKPLYRRLIRAQFKYMAMQNWILGGLSGANDFSKISVYILYHLMTFIVAIASGHLSLIQLISRLSNTAQSTLNAPNLLLMIIFLLSAFLIVIKLWTMLVTYKVHVMPVLGGKYAKIAKGGQEKNNNDQPSSKN